MSFLADLPRTWVTFHLPGTGPRVIPATYVAYDSTPIAPDRLSDFDWLVQARRHPTSSLAADLEMSAQCDLSMEAVVRLLGGTRDLPDDFERFVQSPFGLRDRLRSATSSLFDLGDFIENVDGGRLMHLISDSQWVYHWLLFLGDTEESAVVGCTHPVGFDLPSSDVDPWAANRSRYVVVADSFAEFAWRWWMDNEMFYCSKVDEVGLNPSQRNYLSQYGRPREL